MELGTYIPRTGHTTTMGSITTTNRLYPPSNDRVESWWAKFKLVLGVEKYEVNFVGNFAEQVFGICKLPTFDVDIVLIGKIKDEEELKFILDESARIGFEHHLLMDTFHNAKKFHSNKPELQVAYRSWKYWYRKYPNGRVNEHTWEGEFIETLPSGLIKFDRKDIPPSMIKAKKRFDNGDYVGINISTDDAFDSEGKLKGKIIPNIGIIK